jgi:RNA polymerase sigma factor (sigma-70 family)
MMGVSHFRDYSLDDLLAEAQRYENNDSSAMNEILSRFEPLARKIGSRMAITSQTREDATNAARWGLVQAVRAHKPGRNGFPAFAKLYMRGEASRRLRAIVDPHSTPTSKPFELDISDHEAGHAETDASLEFEAAISVLTPSQRALAIRRYFDDKSLPQIAAERGITVSAVSQRLSTIHRVLSTRHSPPQAARQMT